MVREIEQQIAKQPEDRRTEMYKKVVENVYLVKKNPDWERPVINPNKDPATPFTTSKAVCTISPSGLAERVRISDIAVEGYQV